MDLRSRAVMFARQLDLNADVVTGITRLLESQGIESLECASGERDQAWAQLRIGIDNMVANGFEVGYEAKLDDPGRQGRSLVDRLLRRKRPTADVED